MLISFFVLLILVFLGYLECVFSDYVFFGPLKLIWLVQNHKIISITWQVAIVSFCFLYLLSGRPLFSVVTTICVFGLIVVGSLNKINYLGVPLTIADVYFFLSDPKDNFVLFLSYPFLGLLLLCGLLLLVLIPFYFAKQEKRRYLGKKSLALSLVCIIVTACEFEDVEIESKNYFGMDEGQVGQVAGRAFLSNLSRDDYDKSFSNLIEIFLKKRSISFDVPKKIETPYLGQKKGEPQALPARLPDVVSILNESLFNPRILDVCDKNSDLCDFEIFGPGKKYPGVYGPLLVHTFGGGTWLSEFAFLSGYDWRVFGEGGAYAPRSVVPRLQTSLVKHFKQLGYKTIAVYPVAGNFLNAREAYRSYGFDEFYAIEDLGITTSWQSTSDSVIFDKSLDLIRGKSDGKPIFIFILTIKNHGPHADGFGSLTRLDPDFLKRASKLPASLVDYLSKLKETNDAVVKFRNDWLGSADPRVFLWFGDHHPLLSKNMERSESFSSQSIPSGGFSEKFRFVTWYEITSNISNKEVSAKPVPTDLAFLGTKLLQYSGLPLQNHGEVTLQLAERCPLGLALCSEHELIDRYLSFRVWNLNEIQLLR